MAVVIRAKVAAMRGKQRMAVAAVVVVAAVATDDRPPRKLRRWLREPGDFAAEDDIPVQAILMFCWYELRTTDVSAAQRFTPR